VVISGNTEARTYLIVRLQDPGTDGAYPKSTPVNINLYYLDFLNHYLWAR